MIFEKAVSMNEKYFPEPFKFDPNRFLSDDGSLKEPVLNYRKQHSGANDSRLFQILIITNLNKA